MRVESNDNLILIHTNTYDQYKGLFNEKARDNCTEPFLKLKARLNSLGYKVEYANRQPLSTVKSVIFFDNSHLYRGMHPKKVIKKLLEKKWLKKTIKLDMAILIIWEGQAQGDIGFDLKSHKGFKKILTWNDSLVDNKRYFKFFLPIPESWPNVDRIAFNKKKLLVNISYNKVSSHPRELYSKRVETIRYFDKYFKDKFDLYGHGWDSKVFSSYKGAVVSKAEIFPSYKFGLCYENLEGEKGYITEKIFDCMRSNCVPIYWGASNIYDYVDKEVFIDRRNFKSNKELAVYLKNVSEDRYNQYLEKINCYLKTPNFKKFVAGSFVENIIYHLDI